MKLCLSIGEINKNIFIPILGGIIRFFLGLYLRNLNISKFPIVLCMGSSIGMSLAFILQIIYKYRTKASKINKNNIIIEQNKPKLSEKLKFYLLNAILDFIETFIEYKFCMNIKANAWIFDILFFSLFSYFILDIKIYIHHYISIIVIILIGIILDIIGGVYNKDEILFFILKFIKEILVPLNCTFAKYAMQTKFCSPYEMCFTAGIFDLFLYSILLILSNYIPFFDKFSMNLDKLKLNDLFTFILFVFIKLIYNLCIFITVNNITACHVLIIIVIGELAHYIYLEKLNKIIFAIGFFIILFMTLLFNEIIELNLFGIQKNTKRNISQRADLDIKMMEEKNDGRLSEGGYWFDF